MEKFIEKGVINNPEFHLLLSLQTHGYAIKRKPMDVICCPIDGVYNPFPWRSRCFEGAFLCQEIMVWKGIENDLGHGLLTEFVHLTHRIDVPFIVNPVKMASVTLLDPACLLRCSDRHL